MLEPISAVIPEVFSINGKIVTTSVAVASYFHKRHDHVMDKIRSIMRDCEPAYRLPNFRETSYQRENPNGGDGISTAMYELTRDAFVLIVMGFTGKKALQWKIDYITAFNNMEAELHQPTESGMIKGDSRTIVIHLDESGNIKYSERAPEGTMVTTLERFKLWMEQNGWLVIYREDIKHMTVEQLISMNGAQTAICAR